MEKYPILFFFFLLLIGFQNNVTVYGANQANHYSIRIFIKELNINTYTAKILVQTSVNTDDIQKESVKCTISNQWNVPDQEEPNYGGSESYFLYKRNVVEYYNSSEFTLTIFGARNLYPYDSYMMNLTVNIKDFNNSYINNTEVSVASWPIEWHQEDVLPNFTTFNINENTGITFKVILHRTGWQRSIFENLYGFTYLIVACLSLLDVKKRIIKITVYITIFFSFSNLLLFFTPTLPQKTNFVILFNLFIIIFLELTLFISADLITLFFIDTKLSFGLSKKIKVLERIKQVLINVEPITSAYPHFFIALYTYSIWDILNDYSKIYVWGKYPNSLIFNLLIIFIIITILYILDRGSNNKSLVPTSRKLWPPNW